MLSNPPTDRAMMTMSAPSRAAPRSVVVRTDRPIPRTLAMCSATSTMRGREAGSTSISVTVTSCSDSVLAKSVRSRGVQWVLPPPTMVIRGVLTPRTVAPVRLRHTCDRGPAAPELGRRIAGAARPTPAIAWSTLRTLPSSSDATPVAEGPEPLVVARALTKRFGDFVAVDGVDFEIGRASRSASWVRTGPARPRPCG